VKDENGNDLPPPEPIEGERHNDPAPTPDPSREEGDTDSELSELYDLIDERDREITELRASLDAAISRIGECEAAIGTLRTHNHEEPGGPEERNWWFKSIGRAR